MGRFGMNSKISEIIADSEAKAIVEKYLPGVLNSPDVKYALNMSVRGALMFRGMVGLSKERAEAMKKEILDLE